MNCLRKHLSAIAGKKGFAIMIHEMSGMKVLPFMEDTGLCPECSPAVIRMKKPRHCRGFFIL
jgi:hypothetical protein